MNIAGSFFFVFLLVVRVARMTQSGIDLPGILLSMQSALAAFWLIFHRRSSGEVNRSVQLLAWLSAITPLAMRTTNYTRSGWLSLPGLLLMLWALWSLGSSFGVTPAARKLIVRGPYRYLRHPMYAGEILSLLGFCMGSALPWNWMVWLVFVLSIHNRIFHEEKLLKHYAVYAYFVKWRIVPGVW